MSTTEPPVGTADDAPSETGVLKTDAENDAADLKTQIVTTAKSEVDDAISAGTKLLNTAAGDVPELLTDAESAGVSFLVSKVPGPFAGIVSSFVQTAASAAESQIAATANAEVAKGLTYALAELASVKNHLDAVLK